MTIIFIGDIHQQWQSVERGLASLDPLPRAAILLGDIQCEKPLDDLATPAPMPAPPPVSARTFATFLQRRIPIKFIEGEQVVQVELQGRGGRAGDDAHHAPPRAKARGQSDEPDRDQGPYSAGNRRDDGHER